MANKRFFAFNTLAGCVSSGGISESTTAGYFDSAFVPNAIRISEGAANYMETLPFMEAHDGVEDFWTHFEFRPGGTSSNNLTDLFIWYDAGGVARFRYNDSADRFQYLNASAAWVSVGGAVSVVLGVKRRWDIKIVPGASGSVEVYHDGGLVTSGSFVNASGTDIAKVRWYSDSWNGANAGSFHSQLMAANYDTRDCRYALDAINANGALTDGTGTYTDINEAGLNDGTMVSFAAAGEKKSFTHAARTIPTGYQIGAVVLTARGRVNGAGPPDGELGLRVAGANYMSSDLALGAGFAPRQRAWALNPDGSIVWTEAAYNAAEPILAAAA